MPLPLAALILNLASGYLGAGAVFAILFVILGIGRVDPASRGASLGFRFLIFPGVTLLWPYLAWRWLHTDQGLPMERSPHIRAAGRPR